MISAERDWVVAEHRARSVQNRGLGHDGHRGGRELPRSEQIGCEISGNWINGIDLESVHSRIAKCAIRDSGLLALSSLDQLSRHRITRAGACGFYLSIGDHTLIENVARQSGGFDPNVAP